MIFMLIHLLTIAGKLAGLQLHVLHQPPKCILQRSTSNLKPTFYLQTLGSFWD